jgi:quercetin 2,3-dioxygenase
MLQLRKSTARGHAQHGWLDSFHTFSFGDYFDPKHMGFRSLRVINQDTVLQGQGFGPHPHRDMEIISYVLDGALAHRDSMGNGSVMRPGDVQRMSAGTGVTHSEFNASKTEPVHFLQIWVLPEAQNALPGYEQKTFNEADKRGKLKLVASRNGEGGSVTVHQDLRLYAGLFTTGEKGALAIADGRHAWIHVARGRVVVNGQALSSGDGAALSQEREIRLEGIDQAEVLVFDLA